MDGYDSEDEADAACEIFIDDQLDCSGTSVKIVRVHHSFFLYDAALKAAMARLIYISGEGYTEEEKQEHKYHEMRIAEAEFSKLVHKETT
jgi:hypothetical protein